MWDAFISYAHEDKVDVARPLAEALEARGISVWYDDFTLLLGDDLSKSINRALAESRYGVVILSPSYIDKKWTMTELNALVQREVDRGKTILPVCHQLRPSDLADKLPLLAGKLSVSTDRGLEHVVDAIARVIKPSTLETARPAITRQALPWRGLAEALLAGAVACACAIAALHPDAGGSSDEFVGREVLPRLRSLQRTAEDLQTARGHYLIGSPETPKALENQVNDLNTYIRPYNEALDAVTSARPLFSRDIAQAGRELTPELFHLLQKAWTLSETPFQRYPEAVVTANVPVAAQHARLEHEWAERSTFLSASTPRFAKMTADLEVGLLHRKALTLPECLVGQ